MKQQEARQLAFHVRWMIRNDLPEVLGLERAIFADPTSEEDFVRLMKEPNVLGKVAEEQGPAKRVIAFLVYEIHRTRYRIVTIATAPARRRLGIASQLLKDVRSRLGTNGRDSIRLTLQESNLTALHFFRSQGFLATRLMRDHYEAEDGIEMRLDHEGE